MEIEKLLAILACPACKGDLEFVEESGQSGFLCPQCEKMYPVRDGIPDMLIEDAIERASWPEEIVHVDKIAKD